MKIVVMVLCVFVHSHFISFFSQEKDSLAFLDECLNSKEVFQLFKQKASLCLSQLTSCMPRFLYQSMVWTAPVLPLAMIFLKRLWQQSFSVSDLLTFVFYQALVYCL
mmetsp:Transcript_3638/g.4460  ORF Transcript_3638/g.4460 Transcript_3638/m.4460 type:complete len:107 (+) Transcript_3638:439-759(+)